MSRNLPQPCQGQPWTGRCRRSTAEEKLKLHHTTAEAFEAHNRAYYYALEPKYKIILSNLYVHVCFPIARWASHVNRLLLRIKNQT